MAINEWRGDSQAVAQRTRYTVGGTAQTGDILTLTRNLKEVTYTLTALDTLETAAAGLAAAWEAATFPEAEESTVEYTAGDDFLELLASEPGRPFTVTASVGGGTPTTTLTPSTIEASKGPSHVDDADNWTIGLPDAADDLVIAGGESLLYGLGSIDFTTCDIRASFTNSIGLPKWNTAGYYEDRTREITLNGATIYVGKGDGAGSSRIFAKLVAGATATVYKTGQREDDDTPAVDFGATGNPTAVIVFGASDVGILVEDESTARTIANVALAGDDARLTVGRRLTITNLDMDSGTADVYGIITNPTINRGLYTQHEGLYATLIAYGGTVRLRHTGTSASTNGKGKGDGTLEPIFDCEENSLSRTWTASSMTGGAHLLDENKSVTLGGGTHTADPTFFANSRLGPTVTWSRT
jgi:hypothetical protein